MANRGRSGSMRVLVAVSVALVWSVVVAVPGSGTQPSAAALGDVPAVGGAPAVGDPVGGVASVVPLTPARILDTREPIGVATAGPVGPGGVVELDVTGVGGVPETGVAGVVLNVTVTQPTAPSFVTVWPTGEELPTASSLNMLPGQTVPNLVIAKVGTGGKVSLFNKFGTTHLLADVAGWIPVGSDLTTLTPARILDTRKPIGAAAAGPVGPGGVVELDVAGVGGVPSSSVGAVLLNVTVTDPTAPSFVTVWPTGEELPTASSLNMSPGQTVPNLVIAKVGTGGKVSLFNKFGTTHLIADVVAYTTIGATLNPLTPARLLDTRKPIGVPAVGPIEADGVISLDVLGVGGVPDRGVTAVALNVTVTQPTAASFVATWPTGIPQTDTSALNMLPGETVPNLVIVPIGAGGQIELFNKFGTTHLIADVVAYITPPAGETAPSIAAETMVVTSEHIESIVGDPDNDATITITLEPESGVEVGSIIVTEPTPEAPSGLLRRVLSIVVTPDGTITVTAERASIGEAFPAGSVDMTTSLDGATVRLVEASAAATFGSAVECGAAVKLETDVDGSIDPIVGFQMVWNGGLQSAQVTAGLDIALNFTAKASAEVTCETSKQLALITFAPIVITVGLFPLVFVPEIALVIKLAGKVEGTIDGNAQYGVNMTAGLIYDATDGIDTIGAATPFVTSTWQAGATAEASLTLTPSLTIAAYGIGGPKAAFPMAVTADLDACRTPFWQIKSSIKPTFSIALASWLGGASIADTTYTLNENTIAQGGTPIPDTPGCAPPPLLVTHDSVTSEAVTNAGHTISYDIADLPPIENEDSDAQEVSEVGDAVSGLESVLIDGVVVETRPYTPGGTATAISSSGVAGASANASQTSNLSISEAEDTWTFDISEALTASRTTEDDYDEPIDGDILKHHFYAGVSGYSVVTVRFEVVEPMTLAAATCPPADIYTRVFFTFGQTDLTDESGCIAPGPLETGTYALALHRYLTSQPPSGVLSVTITKP